jgi:superfamily II DNA or RNA helicase
VVTGGGKTVFALSLFERERRNNPDLQMVVIVPSLALLDQWAVLSREFLAISEADVAVFSGEEFASDRRTLNVAVINTARARPLPPGAAANTMLVVDECHRAGAPVNARALEIAAGFTLGLSATPRREFDNGFEQFVEPRLGSVVFEYDYGQARSDGVIVDFALHNFRVPPSLTRFEADSPHRIAAAAVVATRFSGQTLVFTERIGAAERISRLLDGRGSRVGTYHSHLGPAIRRRNLDLFQHGQFDTLVTCRALDEGIDVPVTNVAVIAAGTASVRQRVQRVGRVLRLANGKTHADVATLFATDREAEQLEAEADALDAIVQVQWYEVSG